MIAILSGLPTRQPCKTILLRVGVDEIEDGAANGGLFTRAAKADDAVHFGAVGVDGAKVCHMRSRVARRAAVAKRGVVSCVWWAAASRRAFTGCGCSELPRRFW